MNGDKRHRFCVQRLSSRDRGILFHLTFEEWCNIWEQSGHWDERGRGTGKYCMSRYGDIGAYEIGNVFIQLNKDNSSQAMTGKPAWNIGVPSARKGRKFGTNIKKGRAAPKMACPTCGKVGDIPNMKRWHKCKGVII